MRLSQPTTPFAGHPTLGTAYIIQREIIKHPVSQLDLQLGVGTIPVTFDADGTLWMRQKPVRFGHVFDRSEIATVLGVDSCDVDDRYPVQEASTGNPHMLVPMKSLEAVKRAVVDVPRWRQLLETTRPPLSVKSICIFTTETEYLENDLHVRIFGPLRGVTEDPATGSAIGNLAGYLAHYNYFGTAAKMARKRVEQGYAINRPSLLLFSTQRQSDHIEIDVGGKVRMVAQGQLIDEE
ncbi:phenazine biosynthesis protein [Candidatus Entotheonella serta]|nr:phenazine biosynthesis protein [Candidatus Entotheonella serta]